MRDMQEFFQRRAESLAGTFLTRRDDLVVRRMDLPSGATDFLVNIGSDGDSAGPGFGVRVRPLEHPVQDAGEVSIRLGELPATDVADARIPYCAFVFTMAERGFFKWIREPIVTRGGARLKTVRQQRWHVLDRDAIAGIVDTVNAWYDAQRQAQAA